MVMPVVEFYKVDALPVRPAANAFYYIQRGGYVEAWLTSITGEPSPIGAIAVTQWGEIEGDIELQADLMGLLAAKQDSASLGSAAFADASSFATAAQGLLAENAQPKEAGKGLSEQNYTLAEKDKLAGIEAEATKNRDDSENADKVHPHPISQISGLDTALSDRPTKTELASKSPSILIVDQLRASVEAATGGRQTVIYTNAGNPSYMYVLPAFNCEDVAPNGELGTGTHPAFMFNGVRASEIFVGAHLGGMMGSQVVSHPMLDPRASINFDQARALCKANGPGWDMMSNLDWAAIALWCMANGYQPRGNTNWGRSHEKRWETGRRIDNAEPGLESGTGRTLTGSGGKTWAHDGTDSGIHDLVGNVWEWVTGLKLIDGVIHLAPDNGIYTEAAYTNTGFVMPQNGYTFGGQPNAGASNLVKQSLIVPASAALAPIGYYERVPTGERIPIRGGTWNNAGGAGLGALLLNNARTYAYTGIGFRPRFRNL